MLALEDFHLSLAVLAAHEVKFLYPKSSRAVVNEQVASMLTGHLVSTSMAA